MFQNLRAAAGLRVRAGLEPGTGKKINVVNSKMVIYWHGVKKRVITHQRASVLRCPGPRWEEGWGEVPPPLGA